MNRYTENQILQAIEDEGLVRNAYGYKTPNCIFVYKDAQEKDEVWEDLPPSMEGYEQAHWNANLLEPVNYYLLDDYGHES